MAKVLHALVVALVLGGAGLLGGAGSPDGPGVPGGAGLPDGAGVPGGDSLVAVHGTSSAQEIVPVAPMGTAPPPSSGRCTDPAGTWMGMRWGAAYHWRVDTASIPAYLGDDAAVVDTLRAAADNIMDAHNDCGLAPDLTMREQYVGTTPTVAGVTSGGGCAKRDGQNTVSFGALRPGLLAVTCVWWLGDAGTGRSVEADILIDNTTGLFYLGNTPAGCDGRWDLQGTVTHEFGHVFGLGHVDYATHGELTMSNGLPDCTSGYRGLGLGDYLTLAKEYGGAGKHRPRG